MEFTAPAWDLSVLAIYAFAIFFVIAGIMHIVRPKFYLKLIEFLPYRKFIVYLTGVMEIVLGICLLFPSIRLVTAWLTILFLIAIFPGNIYMAMKPEEFKVSKRAAYIRLPFQLLFIIWVYSIRNISI